MHLSGSLHVFYAMSLQKYCVISVNDQIHAQVESNDFRNWGENNSD